MVDAKDNGDKPIVLPERLALNAPDANAARNATGSDIQAVEAKRTNASDGSATPKNLAGAQDSKQQEHLLNPPSIEISDEEIGLVVSRLNKRTEKDFNDQAPPKVAYDFKDIPKDLNSGLRRAGAAFEQTRESLTSFEAPASPDFVHPHAGKEDEFMSYSACLAANAEFPEIEKRIGLGSGHIDKALIAATIRLEVAYYKQVVDTGQDKYVREHGKDDGISANTSIGPAQMQIRHINRLVHQFPWQLGQFASDPVRAALKKEYAPHFVAGYFSDVIQHINKGTRPDYLGAKDWDGVKKYWKAGDLNAALIYSYNPTKDHIDSVKKQIALIQKKF